MKFPIPKQIGKKTNLPFLLAFKKGGVDSIPNFPKKRTML